MGWKKLLHSRETLSFEKVKDDVKVILEARRVDEGWQVVKKYLSEGINFAEQYYVESADELKRVLLYLKNEKDLSLQEINNINKFKEKNIKLDVRRGYKENNVEKWYFSLGDQSSNFFVIRYNDVVEIDIVMNEKYKYIEEKLIIKLMNFLGLDDSDAHINQNIFYYTKKSNYYLENDYDSVMQDVNLSYEEEE